MHMTSQKGAPVCWGSNEALSRAPSPSMQPAGQPLHAIPPDRPGPAHWLRGWERQRSSSTTRARSATSLDPQHGVVVMETWRQCIRSIPTQNLVPIVCSRAMMTLPPAVYWAPQIVQLCSFKKRVKIKKKCHPVIALHDLTYICLHINSQLLNVTFCHALSSSITM